MITLIAKFRAKEGKEQELADLCVQLAKIVHEKEADSTLVYAPHVGIKDPGLIVFVEKYKDKDSLKAHGQTEYFQAAFPKMHELMDGPGEMFMLKELE
ncbi:MAG: putative quinol monooxygenase [Bacillota bacterium]